jgi:multiple sugar transport system permease protein
VNDDSARFAYSRPKTRQSSAPRRYDGRQFLVGAVCMAICAVMLAPLVVSISASLKTASEAASIPPTYFTHHLSFESYQRLWNYQAGLPTYLMNSGGAAFLTIAFCLLLTIPAGYALARFPVAGKEFIFVYLLLALIVPYQSLLTPIFFMFAQWHLTNTLVGLAIVHTTIQSPSAFTLFATASRRCRGKSKRRRSSTARRSSRFSRASACQRFDRRS